ncbi:MAG: YdeI/OmpD-associated family protein [Chitinophagaceae bacterium]
MKFQAILLSAGKTSTGIEVPEEVVKGLGASKKPAVRVTIKKHTYRSGIASMGGRFMVGVSAENREKAGVAAGEKVEVNIELDTEIREVTIPPDLTAALRKNAAAKKFFEGLSYSNKLRHVMAIEQAKTDETRQRRIDKVVSMMEEGRS